MKHDFCHSPIRKSPGYYSCLNEVKDPKPNIVRPPKPAFDTYAAIIEKERHDADMARQKALMREEEDWVMVDKSFGR
jgi:hypothetical protein